MRKLSYQLFSPWPAEALQFARALERSGRLILAARRGFGTAWELTLPAWRIFRVVSQSNGDLTIANLARRLRIARQSAHAMVHDLSRAGWLELRPAAGRSRRKNLALTAEAVEAVTELDAAMETLLLEMTNDIPLKALKATTALLCRLNGRLQSSAPLQQGAPR